jgi:hypothetical protein
MKKTLLCLLLFGNLCFGNEEFLNKTEFFIKLSKNFSFNQLETIYKLLPDDIQVWGYDIGDYSGDKNDDLAFSYRSSTDSKKNMNIMFFINQIDSFFLASSFTMKYSSLPIEIGFSIQNMECQVTHKVDEGFWEIKSYSMINGNFVMTGFYESKNELIKGSRRKFLGYEKSFNMRNSIASENYYDLITGKKYFKRKYFIIPCYKNNRRIFKDYTTTMFDTNSTFITYGYLNWKDENDLSISFRSTYDDSGFIFTYIIKDDTLLTNSKNGVADHLNLWFDNAPQNLIFTKRDGVYVREGQDENIHKIEINFDNIIMKSTCNNSEAISKSLADGVTLQYSELTKNLYLCKIRVPFNVFGGDLSGYLTGFGWEYFDYDNLSTPEKYTVMSSSVLEAWNPASLGELLIIHDNDFYGKVINYELPKVIDYLKEYGLVQTMR